MTNKLCRICLCTDKKLEELNDNLLEYYQDICDYTSGFSKHMSCIKCKKALKDNLDFRNKCLKSNQILQEWKKCKSRDMTTMKSLHSLLQKSLKNTKNKELNKCVDKKDLSKHNYEFYDVENDSNNIEIKKVKDERKTNEFEMNSEKDVCEIENKTNNATINKLADNKIIDNELDDSKLDNELDDIVGTIGNVADNKLDNELDDINMDVQKLQHEINVSDSDDEKLVINTSDSENVKLKSKYEKMNQMNNNQKKRVYPRKALSEYLEFEEVFDIQLFNTDEDARQELLGRRHSEPYLSAAYRCELCYTVYKCHKLLQFHMKWHTGPGEFVCDICSMRFGLRKALQCHKAKCHRGRFACKLCPLITYYGSAMKAHFQKHQGKTFKCHCDRVFNHISSYLSHKRNVHASSHVCVTCARTFVSELGLLNHRLRAHKTKSKVDDNGTARCVPCGLTFSTQQVYTVHVLNTQAHREQAKDIIGCPYCGLLFGDIAQLKSHKRLKHPKKEDTNDIIKCKLCGAEGVGRSWRRRHYSAAHPRTRYLDEVSDARLVMCERCGKRFTNITLMKDHLNVHLGLKPYACGRCRATFSNNAARHAHVARHLSRDTAQEPDTRRRRRASVSTEVTS